MAKIGEGGGYELRDRRGRILLNHRRPDLGWKRLRGRDAMHEEWRERETGPEKWSGRGDLLAVLHAGGTACFNPDRVRHVM